MKRISVANYFVWAFIFRTAFAGWNRKSLTVCTGGWLRALLGGTNDDPLVAVTQLARVAAWNIITIVDTGTIVNAISVVGCCCWWGSLSCCGFNNWLGTWRSGLFIGSKCNFFGRCICYWLGNSWDRFFWLLSWCRRDCLNIGFGDGFFPLFLSIKVHLYKAG